MNPSPRISLRVEGLNLPPRFPHANFETKNHKREIATSKWFFRNAELFLLSQNQALDNEPNIFARRFLRMYNNLVPAPRI